MNFISLEFKNLKYKIMKQKILVYGKKSISNSTRLFVSAQDFEIPHGYDYKTAIIELDKISKTKIHGRDFLDYFEFSNISLWWFIYQSLIPKYKQKINFIIKFSKLLNDFNPTMVEVLDDFTNLDLIKQICNNNKIKFKFSKINYLKYLSKEKIKLKTQKIRFEKITSNKIKQRKSLDNDNAFSEISDSVLFAIPTSYRRDIFDIKNNLTKRGDFLVDEITELLNNKEKISYVDIDYTFKGDFSILRERLSEKKYWFALENILQQDVYSNEKFFQKYKKLILDKNFQHLFQFNNVLLWPSLESFFKEMSYAPNLPFYITLLSSLEKFLQNNLPKAIFLPYETGTIALAFIIICKKLKIKTIGIQHGYIYEFNPMYSFNNFLTERNMLGFPIPDQLLLFGNHVKQQMISNGYPESNLVSFGNPSFFNLEQIKTSLNQETVYKKYDIPKNKRIILFATGKLQPFYSGHGIYDYDVQIWESLLNNFKLMDDVFLILKPHPSEKNIEIYQKLIQKYDSTNSSIVNGNLKELLSITTITISVFSSAMIDSLCFQKPVLRVKFDDEKHPIFDSCTSIISTHISLLQNNILKIFESKEFRNTLSQDITKFVNNHYGIPENHPEKILEKLLE